MAAACLVEVWFVPRERAGAWIGVLSVVGSLSLHIFGLLFLVPSMFLIRREAALMAAIFMRRIRTKGRGPRSLVCAAAGAWTERLWRLGRVAPPWTGAKADA